MQYDLLGYLLGALDGPEHDVIRHKLEENPRLRAELDQLEARLQPLEAGRWEFDPPAGLAAATCQLVREQAGRVTRATGELAESRSRSSHRVTRMSPSSMSEWNPRKHGWDMLDMVVAAGIFLAAALLFFPAISNSRQEARHLACQNKLRLGSYALSVFGDRRNGILPYIPTQGKTGVAGYYAPQLMEGGFLTEHASFLCPSSPLAAAARNRFRVPTSDQIQAAEGQKLIDLQATMGGSYMYTLGHFQRGRHRATVSLGRSYFPVMADAIQSPVGGVLVSSHGGRGVNVIFEGGNVRCIVRLTMQHPYFVSDRGMVEAGTNQEDPVLGHSWARPDPVKVAEEYPIIDPDSDLWRDLNAVEL